MSTYAVIGNSVPLHRSAVMARRALLRLLIAAAAPSPLAALDNGIVQPPMGFSTCAEALPACLRGPPHPTPQSDSVVVGVVGWQGTTSAQPTARAPPAAW